MLNLTIDNEQKVLITLSPTTSSGRTSRIQPGSLTVTVVSGDSTVQPVDDSSFYLISDDTPEATVTEFDVKADADLGDGVVEIHDSIALTVIDPLAANLGMSAGTPEPK